MPGALPRSRVSSEQYPHTLPGNIFNDLIIHYVPSCAGVKKPLNLIHPCKKRDYPIPRDRTLLLTTCIFESPSGCLPWLTRNRSLGLNSGERWSGPLRYAVYLLVSPFFLSFLQMNRPIQVKPADSESRAGMLTLSFRTPLFPISLFFILFFLVTSSLSSEHPSLSLTPHLIASGRH